MISTGRIVRPEMLDSAPPCETERNLRDLARINRWFGGHRASVSVFRTLAGPLERFSVLDVGAATGDMGAGIRRAFANATVLSLDRRPLHLRQAAPPRISADAFKLPFRERSFDYVMCSLFLHHFRDEEIVELLSGFLGAARRAVVVFDLERHAFAYHFLPATRWLLRWNDITVHDGCISVAAAFRAGELERLGRAAGAKRVVMRRHRPWFRLSMVLSA